MRGTAPTLFCAPPPSHHLCQLHYLPATHPPHRSHCIFADHAPPPPTFLTLRLTSPPPLLALLTLPSCPAPFRSAWPLRCSRTACAPLPASCLPVMPSYAAVFALALASPPVPVRPCLLLSLSPSSGSSVSCHASLRRRPICIVRCARAASPPFLCGSSGTALVLRAVRVRASPVPGPTGRVRAGAGATVGALAVCEARVCVSAQLLPSVRACVPYSTHATCA